MPVDPFHMAVQESENPGNQDVSDPFQDEATGDDPAIVSEILESGQDPVEPKTNTGESVVGVDPAATGANESGTAFNPLLLVLLLPLLLLVLYFGLRRPKTQRENKSLMDRAYGSQRFRPRFREKVSPKFEDSQPFAGHTTTPSDPSFNAATTTDIDLHHESTAEPMANHHKQSDSEFPSSDDFAELGFEEEQKAVSEPVEEATSALELAEPTPAFNHSLDDEDFEFEFSDEDFQLAPPTEIPGATPVAATPGDRKSADIEQSEVDHSDSAGTPVLVGGVAPSLVAKATGNMDNVPATLSASLGDDDFGSDEFEFDDDDDLIEDSEAGFITQPMASAAAAAVPEIEMQIDRFRLSEVNLIHEGEDRGILRRIRAIVGVDEPAPEAQSELVEEGEQDGEVIVDDDVSVLDDEIEELQVDVVAETLAAGDPLEPVEESGQESVLPLAAGALPGAAESEKLANLESELLTLREQLAAEISRSKSEHEKVARLESGMRDLRDQLTGASSEKETLQKQLDEAIAERAALQESLNAAQTEQNSLQEQVSSTSSVKKSLQDLLDAATSEQESLREKLAAEISSGKSEHEKVARLESGMRDLRDQLTGASSEKETLQKQLDEAIAERAALQESLNAAQTEQNSLQEQVSSTSSVKKSLQDLLDAATSEQESLREQLAAASAEQTALQEQLTAASTEQTSLQEQLSAAAAEQTALQEQLLTTTSEQESLQKQLSEANSERNSLQEQIAAASTGHESLAEKLAAATSDQLSLQEQLKSTGSEKTKLEIQLAELKRQLDSKQEELESARAEVPPAIELQWQEKVDYLQNDLAEVQAQSEAIFQELAETRHHLAATPALADTDVGIGAAEQEDLATKLKHKSSKLRMVKSKLREKLDLIKQMNVEMELARTELSEYRQTSKQHEKLTQENDALHDEIAELETKLDRAEASIPPQVATEDSGTIKRKSTRSAKKRPTDL